MRFRGGSAHRGAGERWRGECRLAGVCSAILSGAWSVASLAQDVEIPRRTPAQPAQPAADGADAVAQSTRGHGSISVAYGTSLVRGFRVTDSITAPIGTVRLRSLDLGID